MDLSLFNKYGGGVDPCLLFNFTIFYFLTHAEECPIPIDFAMIVDASGSISRRNFAKLQDFIEKMLDGFDISEKGTHIAIVEYSTKPTVQIKFNEFSGAFLNAANLKRKIRKIKQSRGFTFIDKALQMASTEIFTEENGMRPNVTKVRKCQLQRFKASLLRKTAGLCLS